MSVSIDHRASHVRSILAPALVLASVAFLTVLAVETTQTATRSAAQEELSSVPATQPLAGGESIVYGEPIAMP